MGTGGSAVASDVDGRTQGKVSASVLRFSQGLTDTQWARPEPLIPPATPGGRPRTTDMRAAMNALFYLLRVGCPWRYLLGAPFALRPTVYSIFRKFQREGASEQIWAGLHIARRENG